MSTIFDITVGGRAGQWDRVATADTARYRATSGRAVVVPGLAVIISAAGMFRANDDIFSSFAAGSILVVAVDMLGSLTVLPALLTKLGRWVDRPRIPCCGGWALPGSRRRAARPHVRFGSAEAAGGHAVAARSCACCQRRW